MLKVTKVEIYVNNNILFVSCGPYLPHKSERGFIHNH